MKNKWTPLERSGKKNTGCSNRFYSSEILPLSSDETFKRNKNRDEYRTFDQLYIVNDFIQKRNIIK